MIVQYQYFSWSPPTLTEEQEIELGRQIALFGRDHFIREFRKFLLHPKPKPEQAATQQAPTQGARSWPAPVRYVICAILLAYIAFLLFDLTLMTTRDWGGLLDQILSQLVVVMPLILAIYCVFAWIAHRRFCSWIDRLVSRYAAYVARGGT